MWVHMDGERRHVYISTANTLIQIQPASMTGLAKSSNWNLLCSRIFHIYYFRRMTPLGLGKAEKSQIHEEVPCLPRLSRPSIYGAPINVH